MRLGVSYQGSHSQQSNRVSPSGPGTYSGNTPNDASRRSVLLGTLGLTPVVHLSCGDLPASAASSNDLSMPSKASRNSIQLPVGAEVREDVAKYFDTGVRNIASQIDQGFIARLAVYGVTSVLPSGIPGDPSRDYVRGNKARCGLYRPASDRPYDICPAPMESPGNESIRQCCRHYAFCVPYSRPAFAVEDRISTVVISPRLYQLPEDIWKAILAHELGHAVDFYLFGRRYRLSNHQATQADLTLTAQLNKIDEEELDAEVRADALGELLVLRQNEKLCYDPGLTLQRISSPDVACDGDGTGKQLMRHYLHPPISGIIAI